MVTVSAQKMRSPYERPKFSRFDTAQRAAPSSEDAVFIGLTCRHRTPSLMGCDGQWRKGRANEWIY